ncbi:MAG: lipid-transfer protein [Micromonosporaceae bacterium]|nr:lipid-transfer protein [Micromonosporaceae bacterium]
MTEIAVVGFAHSVEPKTSGATNGVELLVPLFQRLYADLGITKGDIGFWCSGSSDYLAGRAFSFISAIDAIGACPPIMESHVEADAAWALYEAWVKLRMGEVDTALVYGFGKSTAGELRRVLAMQLDPYTTAPLWPDATALAALQARLGIEAGLWTEKEMAEVAARSTRAEAAALLEASYVADPLREHDCAPYADGATAVVLAAGDRARELCDRPAWITGIAHRIDSPSLGARDLTRAPSARTAAEAAGTDSVEVAELHTPYTHQELVLRRELDLADGVRVNPAGGVLGGHAMFAAGLARIGEAARHIMSGAADRVLAHATNGPLLQQNLVCAMSASPSRSGPAR